MGTVTPLPRTSDRTIHLPEAVQRFLTRDTFEPATRDAYQALFRDREVHKRICDGLQSSQREA